MSLEVHIQKQLRSFAFQVDFSLGDENLAVVGASGSGKSMLLKCIAGIETPDEGEIVINGKTCFAAHRLNVPSQKRRVGYLFQDYALFPHLTVKENLTTVLSGTKAEREEKALRLLKQFHLEHLLDSYPYQISGGEQQRAALSRMLCVEPDILLLDEPFSALDTNLKWSVENDLVQLLQRVQKSVVLVTHSMAEALRICSRILILDHGKVVDFGAKEQVLEHPRTMMSAQLAGYKNFYSRQAMPALFAAVQVPEGKDYMALDARRVTLLPGAGSLPLSVQFCYRTEDQEQIYYVFMQPGGNLFLTMEIGKNRAAALPVYQRNEDVTVYFPKDQILLF